MKLCLFYLSILISAAASAQCPVDITRLAIFDSSHGIAMYANYTNITEKKIVGVSFRAIFIDAVGDRHPAYEGFDSGLEVKPGKSKQGDWSYIVTTLGNIAGGVIIEPMKVKFEDGSLWQTSESDKCSWEKEKKGPLHRL